MAPLVLIARACLLEATDMFPRFTSGMSKRGIAFRRLPGTKDLLRLLPGPRINGGWLRAPSMDAFAFGMLAQGYAFVFWKVIGPMSVRWTSVSAHCSSLSLATRASL